MFKMYSLTFETWSFGCFRIRIKEIDSYKVVIPIYCADVIPWCKNIINKIDTTLETESITQFANSYAKFSHKNNSYLEVELSVDGIDHCDVLIFTGKYPLCMFDELACKLIRECNDDRSFFRKYRNG